MSHAQRFQATAIEAGATPRIAQMLTDDIADAAAIPGVDAEYVWDTLELLLDPTADPDERTRSAIVVLSAVAAHQDLRIVARVLTAGREAANERENA